MGNIVGFAFDKVQEGLSWMASLVSQGIDSCFRKLKEAFTWVASKIKKFFTSLIENLRDLLGHNKEFINMVWEAEKMTGQRLKLVPFGKDEQKNPSEIGNILSDLQKSCLPFLAALSKLEEFEKLSFPLPGEFEERIDGFFPNKFESLADENEGKGASAFSKPEEFGEEKLGFALPEGFEEERIDGFFPNKFESLADPLMRIREKELLLSPSRRNSVKKNSVSLFWRDLKKKKKLMTFFPSSLKVWLMRMRENELRAM